MLIEIDQGRRNDPLTFAKGVASGVLRNPIIMAIVFAYLWRGIGIPLGGAPLRLLELVSQAAPTLALVCLGASLPTPRQVSAWREAIFAAAIKLVLLPLAMAGAARWASLPPQAATIMVVTAALPTGANAFMLARSAGSLMESSAATVVLSTALSVVTLSIVLVFFHS